jgi:hypothetical protein
MAYFMLFAGIASLATLVIPVSKQLNVGFKPTKPAKSHRLSWFNNDKAIW